MTSLANALGIDTGMVARVATMTEALATNPPADSRGVPSDSRALADWTANLSFTAGLHWLLVDEGQSIRAFRTALEHIDPAAAKWRHTCESLISPSAHTARDLTLPESRIATRGLHRSESVALRQMNSRFQQMNDDNPSATDWLGTEEMVRALAVAWVDRIRPAIRQSGRGLIPLGRPLIDPVRYAYVAAAQREYMTRYHSDGFMPRDIDQLEAEFVRSAARLAMAAG